MKQCNRTGVWAAVVLAAVSLASGAAHAAKGLRDTPVTSTLGDSGTIVNDGHGPYVDFTSRKDAVQSIIQTSNSCCHDWILSLENSTSRTMQISLQNPVGTVPSPPPFSVADVRGRILVNCHAVYAGSFPAMTSGQSLQCPTSVTWPVSGSSTEAWRIAFFPIYTDTELPVVTCLSTDSGGCNHWTIDSTGGATSGALVGRLEQIKGTTVLATYGDYYMSFAFDVTRP